MTLHTPSPTDRSILTSYLTVLDGLASYLGNSCEIVLHDLNDYEHSVIGIFGGNHTGRTVGAPITDIALKMLSSLTPEKNAIVYFTTNQKGEPLWGVHLGIIENNSNF